MPLLAAIYSVAVLAGIAVQDFRRRAFAWWWLPLLCAGFAWMSVTHAQDELLYHFAVNMAFVGLQLVLLYAWFSLRARKLVRLIDTHIGLGDVLLFVCLALLFSPVNFIVFFCISLVFALLVAIGVKLLRPDASPLIPLAGLLAFPVAFCCMASVWFDFNLHDDTWLLGFISSTP
jgi:ABC-type uncharacterized transport system permease subunit